MAFAPNDKVFIWLPVNIFFFREFYPRASALDNNSLLSDQDTNQFLVQVEIEPQISYITIRDFTS